MNTSLDRKDIEEFWRRSNSISEKDGDPDNLQVQVRRMSLAEFTGLNPEHKLADLETPTWKSSVSQSSLLNSFSTRRRSVLSNDTLDSPTRRLASRNEENMDVHSAIARLKSIELKSSEWKQQSCNYEKLSEDLCTEKKITNDAISRLQHVVKQLNQTPSSSTSMIQPLLSETVAAAHSLSTAIHQIKINTSVYHSELVGTELTQVFGSLISFVAKLDSPTMSANISTPARKLSLISNSFSQLIANLNVLSRAVASI